MFNYVYDIALTTSPVIATALLAVVGGVLWRRTRTFSAMLVMAGFLVAVIGWFLVNAGRTEPVYHYAQGGVVGATFHTTYLFSIGRLVAALGFLVGGAALLWHVLVEKAR